MSEGSPESIPHDYEFEGRKTTDETEEESEEENYFDEVLDESHSSPSVKGSSSSVTRVNICLKS